MKKLLLALVLAGLAAAVPSLHAQSVAVNVALRAYSQNPTVTNGPNERFTVSKPAFTTLHLLGLIANALNTNFPPTAKLVMVNYSTFQVQMPDGLVLENLSTNLIRAANGFLPNSGTFNVITRRDIQQYFYVLRIVFDDGSGNDFDLSGFTTENYSRSALGANNLRILRDSFLMTAAGDGRLRGQDVVFTGRVSGSSRALVVD